MGWTRSQFHRLRDRPGGEVARRRTAGAVEPSARPRTFGDRRRRRAGCSRCTAPATAARRQGPWDAEERVVALDAKTGKTIWEHKYPSRRRGLQLRRRPALDAARRRRPRVHDRHEPAVVRVRQTNRQGALVARLHQGVQSPELLDPADREDRLRLQPDRLRRHDHLQRRRSRTVGDGVPAERRRGGVEERRLPHGRGGADPDRRWQAVPQVVFLARRHGHRPRSSERPRFSGRIRTIPATI